VSTLVDALKVGEDDPRHPLRVDCHPVVHLDPAMMGEGPGRQRFAKIASEGFQ
jgi:hypothetical protein